MADEIRKKASNLLHAGVSLLHQVTSNFRQGESSDDEKDDPVGESKFKRILFDSDASCEDFHSNLQFVNDFGRLLRSAFAGLDISGRGFIGREEVKRGCLQVDLKVTDDDVDKMLNYAYALEPALLPTPTTSFSDNAPRGSNNNSKFIDFFCFFRIFTESFVSSMRDVFEEWYVLAGAGGGAEWAYTLSGKGAVKIGLISGELVAFAPKEKVHWAVNIGKVNKHAHFFPGSFFVTNYRIILTSSSRRSVGMDPSTHNRYEVPAFFTHITLPLSCILKIHVAPPRHSLYIHMRDGRCACVTLSVYEAAKSKVDALLLLLNSLTCPPPSAPPTSYYFAYKCIRPLVLVGGGGGSVGVGGVGSWGKQSLPSILGGGDEVTGWGRCDVLRDYERM
eukprot:gene35461-42983_t